MAIPATITEQIEKIKETEISYRNLHPCITITISDKKTIQIPFSNIISKYSDYLSSIIVTKKLTEAEFNKYRYSPKKLSQDLYGTVELWDALLQINSCVSLKDFNKQEIKYYNPAQFKKYLNEIIILEETAGNIKI